MGLLCRKSYMSGCIKSDDKTGEWYLSHSLVALVAVSQYTLTFKSSFAKFTRVPVMFCSGVLFCCWHCLLFMLFRTRFIFLLLFIVFTRSVLAARITQCILYFVKMQSDYSAPVRCAVPILRVLTMISRGIIDVEYIISSATLTLPCLISKLRIWPMF